MPSWILLTLVVSMQFVVESAVFGQEIEVLRRIQCDPWTNTDGTLIEMREAGPSQCGTPILEGVLDELFGLKLFKIREGMVMSVPNRKIPLVRSELVEFFSHYCIEENAGGGNFDMWDRPPPDINGSTPPCDRGNMPKAHLRRSINLQDPKEPLIMYPPTGMQVSSNRLEKGGREMLNALIALIRREPLDAQAKREEAEAMKVLEAMGVDKFMAKKKK